MKLTETLRQYAEPFKQPDSDIMDALSDLSVSDAKEYAYILDRAANEIERLQKEVAKREQKRISEVA